MKISGEEALRSYSLAKASRSTTAAADLDFDTNAGSLSLSSSAEATISSQARDIQLVKSALAQLPDVRQDRVDELKALVQSGKYQVSGDDIADLMIRRALADSTNL